MTDKICVVAAAGPGMGQAIGRRFAREGFRVVLIARDAKKIGDVTKAVGGGAEALSADLTNVSSIETVFSEIIRSYGPPQVLVYNGGVWREKPAVEITAEEFAQDLALCVTGAHACVRMVAPHMIEAKKGTILFTGGGLALNPTYGAGVASLVAGKAALRGYGFALAESLKAEGIHVGMVTIAGLVKPGTPFDPDRIADRYWALHRQPQSEWAPEIIHSGDD